MSRVAYFSGAPRPASRAAPGLSALSRTLPEIVRLSEQRLSVLDAIASPDSPAPLLLLKREDALVEFNRRVLAQARRDDAPLLVLPLIDVCDRCGGLPSGSAETMFA